jgi:hypothetical protein
VALPRPVPDAIPDDMQLSLGFVEIPAPTSDLWQGLASEQRAAAVTALARLIAKTMNFSEEDDRG